MHVSILVLAMLSEGRPLPPPVAVGVVVDDEVVGNDVLMAQVVNQPYEQQPGQHATILIRSLMNLHGGKNRRILWCGLCVLSAIAIIVGVAVTFGRKDASGMKTDPMGATDLVPVAFSPDWVNVVGPSDSVYCPTDVEWSSSVNLILYGDTYRAQRLGIQPQYYWQLSASTPLVMNVITFPQRRIQDEIEFQISFEIKISSDASGEGLFLFVGATSLPATYEPLERGGNAAYTLAFQIRTNTKANASLKWTRGMINLMNSDGIPLASYDARLGTSVGFLGDWQTVIVRYTRGVVNTWRIGWNGIDVITFSDVSNAAWLSTSGGLYGFGYRSGAFVGTSYVRSVSVCTIRQAEWSAAMSLTTFGDTYTAQRLGVELGYFWQLSASTPFVMNVICFPQRRIQDEGRFEVSFDVKISSSAIADGLFFFVGATSLPATYTELERGGNAAFTLSFQIYSHPQFSDSLMWKRGMINLMNGDRLPVASYNALVGSSVDFLTDDWQAVNVTYTRGTINTWRILWKGIEVITYDDVSNADWLSRSGALCGFGYRSESQSGTSYVRRVLARTLRHDYVVTSTLAQWTVTFGSCTVDYSGCLLSPYWPASYGNNDSCIIEVVAAPFGQIRVVSFDTESQHDILTVNGISYSGTSGPDGITPVGNISWISDGTNTNPGWKLCVFAPTETRTDLHLSTVAHLARTDCPNNALAGAEWSSSVSLRTYGSTYAARRLGVAPDYYWQLSANTKSAKNVITLPQKRIQDEAGFVVSFEIMISSQSMADGLYFFVGADDPAVAERGGNQAYTLTFQTYTWTGQGARADWQRGMINLMSSDGLALASYNSRADGSPGFLMGMWQTVSVIYTRGTVNTWRIMWKGIEVILYSDLTNADWLATSGAWYGFGYRSGDVTGTSYVRRVSVCTYQQAEWSSFVSLTTYGDTYTAERLGVAPDYFWQLSASTPFVMNVISFPQRRLQDEERFEVSFEIKINSDAAADGLFFFVGATSLPATYFDLEHGGNAAYTLTFQIYTNTQVSESLNWKRGMINLIDDYRVPLASYNALVGGVVGFLTGDWQNVSVMYTRGTINTWQVVWNGTEVFTYNDVANAAWLSTSGPLCGFGYRSGQQTGTSYLRRVWVRTMQ